MNVNHAVAGQEEEEDDDMTEYRDEEEEGIETSVSFFNTLLCSQL